MKAYILTLAGAVLLSAVLSILVSDGKMGKFIKGMTKLLVFSIVAAPLISLFAEGEFALPSAEIGHDEGYLERCAELLSERDAAEIEAYLSEEFALPAAEVQAKRGTEDGFPLKKITVILQADGIFGQDGHIDMVDRIRAALFGRFGCEAEVIWRGTD